MLGILGDGPAAHLAALAAYAAGVPALWVGRGPSVADAAQGEHIHILRAEIRSELARIDPSLTEQLEDVIEPEHCWIDATGQRRIAPRLTRSGLTGFLSRCCTARGLAPVHGIDPLAHADLLWIDATGGGRALARLFDNAGHGWLELDDMGAPEQWVTRIWRDPVFGMPTTLVVPGILYLESDATGTRVTGALDHGAGQLPEALSLPVGPPARNLRMVCPPVRLARWQGSPLLLLGDARLQTPPSMGFGLLAVVQQAALLADGLRTGSNPEHLLSDWAEAMWLAAGLRSSLPFLDPINSFGHAQEVTS